MMHHGMACVLFLMANFISAELYALSIGAKGRVTGPTIHSTYFLTTNNQPLPVQAKAYVGKFINNTCQYSAIYDIGNEVLETGDFIDIDAFALRSVIGTGYTCMSIYYTYTQRVIDTFILGWDGLNYTVTNPEKSEVTIL